MFCQSQSVVSLGFGTFQLCKALPTPMSAVRCYGANKLLLSSCLSWFCHPHQLVNTVSQRSLLTLVACRPHQPNDASFTLNSLNILHPAKRSCAIPLVKSVRNASAGSKGKIPNIDSKIASLTAIKKGQGRKKRTQVDSEVDTGSTTTDPIPSRPSRSDRRGAAYDEYLQQHDFLTFDPGLELPHSSQHRPRRPDREVIAYATADEYDLEAINQGFKELGLYVRSSHHIPGMSHGSPLADNDAGLEGTDPSIDEGKAVKGFYNFSSQTNDVLDTIPDISEVLHVLGQYKITPEERQIYFFRDGAIVFWNVSELERINVLTYISRFALGSTVSKATVEEQSESFPYLYSEGKTRLSSDRILLSDCGPTHLERYTFSNALALSVKLGVWESELEYYIDSIENVTEEMKSGRVILKNKQVLAHLGQLYSLRHSLKMSSGLLDTPDYYWERKTLEQLYERTTTNLSVSKRMQVMSDKLNNCLEMMSVLKDYHAVVHGHRLEVIIIVLIVVEVIFEAAHFLSKEGTDQPGADSRNEAAQTPVEASASV